MGCWRDLGPLLSEQPPPQGQGEEPVPVSQRGSQWEFYLLGLVQEQEFSTRCFSGVWLLIGLGVASRVENDVGRQLGTSSGSQCVGPHEGKKCHAKREKWAFVTVISKIVQSQGRSCSATFRETRLLWQAEALQEGEDKFIGESADFIEVIWRIILSLWHKPFRVENSFNCLVLRTVNVF